VSFSWSDVRSKVRGVVCVQIICNSELYKINSTELTRGDLCGSSAAAPSRCSTVKKRRCRASPWRLLHSNYMMMKRSTLSVSLSAFSDIHCKFHAVKKTPSMTPWVSVYMYLSVTHTHTHRGQLFTACAYLPGSRRMASERFYHLVAAASRHVDNARRRADGVVNNDRRPLRVPRKARETQTCAHTRRQWFITRCFLHVGAWVHTHTHTHTHTEYSQIETDISTICI